MQMYSRCRVLPRCEGVEKSLPMTVALSNAFESQAITIKVRVRCLPHVRSSLSCVIWTGLCEVDDCLALQCELHSQWRSAAPWLMKGM